MRALFEHRFLFGILQIDLRAFENLQRDSSIRVDSKERATTRLTDILHHTADTQRAVQLTLNIKDQLGIFQQLRFRILHAQLLLQEMNHLFHLVVRILAAVDQLQILEDAFLQRDQHTGDHLLEDNGRAFETVRNHIVDILDKHHIGIYIVQVFDQSTVAARTEQQITVLVAERIVFHIGGNRIGTRFLHAERNIVFDREFLFIISRLCSNQLFEQRLMFGRHSEMYIHFAGIVLRIHRTFGQMFFHRRTGCLRIRMKKQQTFRKLSVVQSFRLQQVGDNSLILSESD